MFALFALPLVLARGDDTDPVYDGKKTSEWVDIVQKAIIVNMGHKMCRKLIDQGVKAAVNLNILRVLVTAVLDYKKEELPDITPETILNLQSEMIATTWMDT